MSENETSAAPAAEPKTPKRGIGTVIREAIIAGKSNEEALAAAKAEFPDAGTTASTVSWYRNQLRKQGHNVPTARELKKANAPAKDAKKDGDKPAEGEGSDPLA